MKKRKKQRKNETKRIWLERQKGRTKDTKKHGKKQRMTEKKKERKEERPKETTKERKNQKRKERNKEITNRHVLAPPSKAQQEATCSDLTRCFANGGPAPPPTPPLIFLAASEQANLCKT